MAEGKMLDDEKRSTITWLQNIKEKYIHGGDDYFDDCRRLAIDKAIKAVKQPEIVRCKDCKHWIGGGIDDNDNFIPPRCTLFNEPQTSEWFCPEGQRMESD